MPVIMTITFFLGVQFVPPEARSFTIRTDQAVIRFSRLDDDGWKAVLDSGVDMGVWRVEDTRVITEVEGEQQTLDLAEFISPPADKDWTTVSEVNLGAMTATLETRRGDQDVTIVVKYDETENVVTITWP
jgi:hypothetical protein